MKLDVKTKSASGVVRSFLCGLRIENFIVTKVVRLHIKVALDDVDFAI